MDSTLTSHKVFVFIFSFLITCLSGCSLPVKCYQWQGGRRRQGKSPRWVVNESSNPSLEDAAVELLMGKFSPAPIIHPTYLSGDLRLDLMKCTFPCSSVLLPVDCWVVFAFIK